MIFIGFRVHYLGNVETLNLVLGDLIVASDHNIVDILACENHEDALMERQDRVLASLEIVHDIVAPHSYIEEVSHGLRLL